jgi:hypothetical protein
MILTHETLVFAPLPNVPYIVFIIFYVELIQEGFSDDDIIKLIGGNFLRVLEAAEATAQLISN